MTPGPWLRRRLLEPLLAQLRQGMSAERLAWCIAVGIVVGNIPILGVSTLLCTLIALAFRLNLPTLQLVQAAMAPTQLLLIVPFVRLGEWLTRAPPERVSLEAGRALLAQGIGPAVDALWSAILHAGLAWLLTAPALAVLLHRALLPLLRHAAAKLRPRAS